MLPKTINKVDEKNAENSIEKWRPNVPKNGAQREAKTTQDPDKLPTKSRHGARDPPRRQKGGKKEPKWSQKGGKREPESCQNSLKMEPKA